ncbi:two-component regulator propeller domain-containing protein [Ferrimonas pelagia]|uniref:histidine kinase n=1 Tax=Ferrimonas pelagia TaxID=1177826 RepID=A0ABP9F4U5_9GAMM
MPISQQFGIETHQAGSQIWWADQLDDGLMVFATANGMASFDGTRWQLATTDNNTRIRSLAPWHDGRIYAGAIGELGYFERQPEGHFAFTPLATQALVADPGEVWSVAVDEHLVVFSCQNAVLVWNGEQLSALPQLASDGFRFLPFQGQLYLKPRTQGQIYRLTGERQAQLEAMPWQIEAAADIKALLPGADGEPVAITYQHGIWQLRGDRFEPLFSPEQLPAGGLYGGAVDQAGYAYINSSTDGVLMFSPQWQLLRHYRQQDGLYSGPIYHVFVDRQDQLWVSGLPGIASFTPPHKFSQYLSDTGTRDLESLQWIGDRLWFYGTGLYRLEPGAEPWLAPQFVRQGTFDHVVWDLQPMGDLILVAADDGVYALSQEGGEPERIVDPGTVVDLVVWPDQRRAFAASDEGIYLLERQGDGWHSAAISGLEGVFEYVEVQTTGVEQPVLWASSAQQQLYRLEGIQADGHSRRLQRFDAETAPLGHDHVVPYQGREHFWFGTQHGLLRHDERADVPFFQSDDLPEALRQADQGIFLLEQSEPEQLWFQAGADTGLLHTASGLSGQTLTQSFRPYNQAGVRGLAARGEAMWLGTSSAQVIRIPSSVSLPAPAVLAIRQVTDLEQQIPLAQSQSMGATVEYGRDSRSLRIGYGLRGDHALPRPVQYRTRMQGALQQHWSPWSTDSSKDFIDLRGGQYRFELEARDPWGRVLRSDYSFAVAYPWYWSPLAWLGYAVLLFLALGSSAWWGQRWRTRRLQLQNRKLSLLIARRTRQLRRQTERLQQQQELKDRFFANVSHEFRTPLTLIIGSLGDLVGRFTRGMSPQARQRANTALTNANRMLALVGQVLDMDRLELGAMQLRIIEHDIAALMRRQAQRFEDWAGQQGQSLVLEGAVDPLLVYCDQDQLEKCIANLLSNAIKYSGAGTQITLSLCRADGQVGIQVRDDGIGLSDAEQAQIFDRFYQAPAATGLGGSGIGLALVKEVMALHHGQISLSSQLDQGCCFTLWLQLGHAHFDDHQLLEPRGQSTARQSTDTDSARVLLVDDNAELRAFLCQSLEGAYQLFEAHDGEQGLQMARQYLPDVIVSDVTMPGLSGIEMTEQLKAAPDTAAIPVLLLSANTTKRHVVAGFDAGASDYLTKPFDTAELIVRINELLRQQQALCRDIELKPSGRQQVLAQFELVIQALILARIDDPKLTVAELATSMDMSAETLRRRCRQELNMSPNQLMVNLRIAQAKRLLQHGQHSVSEIADAVGFDSLAYFSRTFKKQTGVSPSEFVRSIPA